VLATCEGVHLVEVIVATALFASAMTTLPLVFALAAKVNVAAADTTHATVLAMQKMEDLRARPSLEALATPEVDVLNGIYRRTARAEPLNASFPQTWVLTVIVGRQRPITGLLDVDGPGAVRLVTLRTFTP
jgi:hypothetical protein